MSHPDLMKLMENLAALLLPLFAHRFSKIGSLYLGPDPEPMPTPESSQVSTGAPTPTGKHPMVRTLSVTPVSAQRRSPGPRSDFHVGPIISWPFFGSNRGELTHPTELKRGPWQTTRAYLKACVEREVNGVKLENEGKTAPHRLHLDPDEILSSRHHHVPALSGDVSDTSDEWDWEDSEAEWDGGPGNRMYQDYRRMQRSTFLVAHLQMREEKVKQEMDRFMRMMEKLGACKLQKQGQTTAAATAEKEEFALDCHDLNLENVFVDETDPSNIVRRQIHFIGAQKANYLLTDVHH